MKNIYFLFVMLFVCQISIANHRAFVVTDPTLPTLSNISMCDDNNDGFSVFDLTVQDAVILAAQTSSASNYSISYYETSTDAAVGANAISNSTSYYNFNSGSQMIYVRIRNVNTNQDAFGQFQIIVNQRPFPVYPSDYNLCDFSGAVGYEAFDLDILIQQILGGASSALNSVSFYTSQTDAETGTNMITNSSSYVNQVIWTQTLYARVTTIATGCYGVVSFNIVVTPSPNSMQPNYPQYSLCDATGAAGYEIFDLGSKVAFILLGQTGMTVSFYPSLVDAQNNTNVITNLVYQNTTIYVQTMGIRITNNSTGCIAISTMDIRVEPLPSIVQPLPPYRVCDDNADGLAVFNLANPILASEILGPTQLPADFSVSYYLTASGANPLTNTGQTPLPASYTNTTSTTQNVYIRVVNNATGCANGTGVLTLAVEAYATATGPQTFTECDSYMDPYDGVDRVDLTQFAFAILNGQNPAVFIVSYYTSQADAIAGINALTIAEAQAYVMDSADTDTVWVKVENSGNSIPPFCYAITTINISVERYPNPIINTVNNINTICVNYLTGAVLRDLTLSSGIVNPSAYSFEWYEMGNPSIVIGTGATYTVDTPAASGATRDYVVHVTRNSALSCDTSSAVFSVIQSGPASIPTSSSGYSIINLSGVQSIVVDIIGFGTYEYSLDNGPRQTSNVFDNVTLGSHIITVFDIEGGLYYSCDPLIITNVLIETSQVSAPTGLNSQTFTAGATLANLAVSGSNIQWYASASNKMSALTVLPINTLLVDGTTYYASQTISGVESVARLPVTVHAALGMPTNEFLSLYYAPNPVKNVLTLKSNTILKSVSVYNFLGQKVIEQSVNDSNATIDFSFLPSGNYMVKAQGDTAQKIIKIVKQ